MQTTLEKLAIVNSKVTEVKFSVVLSRADKLLILKHPDHPSTFANDWSNHQLIEQIAKAWQLKPNPDYDGLFPDTEDPDVIIWETLWDAVYDAVESFMKQAYQLGLIEVTADMMLRDFFEARQPACE